jgi:hypothetical protein
MIHPTSETAKQEILDYAKEHLSVIVSVIEAKEILYKKGYYISKLFHVSDVTEFYQCSNEVAYNVIDKAILMNDHVMEEIWYAIEKAAKEFNLEPK